MKTGLKVVSILQIILGALTLIVGLLATGLFAAGGAAGAASAGVVAGLIGLTVVFVILGGVFDILSGIFGLRAAKDASKATPAVVFGAIALVLAVISLIMDFGVQSLLGCVIPVLYFVFVLNIKKAATKTYDEQTANRSLTNGSGSFYLISVYSLTDSYISTTVFLVYRVPHIRRDL